MRTTLIKTFNLAIMKINTALFAVMATVAHAYPFDRFLPAYEVGNLGDKSAYAPLDHASTSVDFQTYNSYERHCNFSAYGQPTVWVQHASTGLPSTLWNPAQWGFEIRLEPNGQAPEHHHAKQWGFTAARSIQETCDAAIPAATGEERVRTYMVEPWLDEGAKPEDKGYGVHVLARVNPCKSKDCAAEWGADVGSKWLGCVVRGTMRSMCWPQQVKVMVKGPSSSSSPNVEKRGIFSSSRNDSATILSYEIDLNEHVEEPESRGLLKTAKGWAGTAYDVLDSHLRGPAFGVSFFRTGKNKNETEAEVQKNAKTRKIGREVTTDCHEDDKLSGSTRLGPGPFQATEGLNRRDRLPEAEKVPSGSERLGPGPFQLGETWVQELVQEALDMVLDDSPEVESGDDDGEQHSEATEGDFEGLLRREVRADLGPGPRASPPVPVEVFVDEKLIEDEVSNEDGPVYGAHDGNVEQGREVYGQRKGFGTRGKPSLGRQRRSDEQVMNGDYHDGQKRDPADWNGSDADNVEGSQAASGEHSGVTLEAGQVGKDQDPDRGPPVKQRGILWSISRWIDRRLGNAEKRRKLAQTKSDPAGNNSNNNNGTDSNSENTSNNQKRDTNGEPNIQKQELGHGKRDSRRRPRPPQEYKPKAGSGRSIWTVYERIFSPEEVKRAKDWFESERQKAARCEAGEKEACPKPPPPPPCQVVTACCLQPNAGCPQQPGQGQGQGSQGGGEGQGQGQGEGEGGEESESPAELPALGEGASSAPSAPDELPKPEEEEDQGGDGQSDGSVQGDWQSEQGQEQWQPEQGQEQGQADQGQQQWQPDQSQGQEQWQADQGQQQWQPDQNQQQWQPDQNQQQWQPADQVQQPDAGQQWQPDPGQGVSLGGNGDDQRIRSESSPGGCGCTG